MKCFQDAMKIQNILVGSKDAKFPGYLLGFSVDYSVLNREDRLVF